jgi:hypothetical protein
MEAINNLNKNTDLRNNMISYIVNSKSTSKMSDKQYDALENKLLQKSFAQLKKEYDTLKSKNQMKNGGEVGERFVFGIEYKEKPSSKVFRKTALEMVGSDTKEMNAAINKNAESLKKQEGWHEIKITKKPIMKNGGGIDINELNIPVIRTQFEDEEYEFKDGGRVDKDYMYSKFDFNKSGNFFATINNKNYEIIYRDDISQMYDLFENDKKIKSSKNLADLFYFPKKYSEGGATKGFCYTIGGL